MSRSRVRSGACDPAIEPIFLLAGCEARRAALHRRTREVLASVDFAELERRLTDRWLLPLIGGRAVEAAPDLCPPEFTARVETALRGARVLSLAIEGETRRLVARLERRGIRALPLKGPLLAADVHGDTGLRHSADVDLLVSRVRLDDAAELLGADLASTPDDPLRRNGLPDLHLSLRPEGRPTVELHWRVHWYEEAFSEDMLARAEPGADGLLRARSDDLAASLLLYYARDGFFGVRHAADIAAWWDRHGRALPDRFLEGHARRYPELAPALSAAAAVAERMTGVPARGWLGGAAVTTRRSLRIAERLADWAQAGDRDQLAANISLVDGLLGPPGSARAFVERELSPPQGSTVGHATKVLARYAIALWRIRGGRTWAPTPAALPD
jgi:hypothetical protein